MNVTVAAILTAIVICVAGWFTLNRLAQDDELCHKCGLYYRALDDKTGKMLPRCWRCYGMEPPGV